MKNENNTESQNPGRRYSKRSFYLNKKKNLENKIENQEPKIEEKIEQKVEEKIEPKMETKVESKIEPKSEPKIETKIETKIEVKNEEKIKPKIELKIKVAKKADKINRNPYVHHSHPKLNQKNLFIENNKINTDLLSIKKYNSSKKIINIETLQNKIFFSENKNSKKSYFFLKIKIQKKVIYQEEILKKEKN